MTFIKSLFSFLLLWFQSLLVKPYKKLIAHDLLSKTVVIGPVITVMLGQQKRESLGQKDWRYYGGHWAKNSLLIVRSKRRLLGQNASVVPF